MSSNNCCKNKSEQEDDDHDCEMNIHSIIDDIWIDILFFVNGFDFISMNQTCKYFYNLTCESSILIDHDNNINKYHGRIKEHFAIITKHQYLNIQRIISTMNDELSQQEPALEAAIQSVKRLKKRQIDEIRHLKNPPTLIKMTFEATCILSNKQYRDWREVCGHIRKPRFIYDLCRFDTTTVTSNMIEILEKKYLSNEQFTYQRVNKLSKSCGPIIQWVINQVKFARLLQYVAPMKEELVMCQHQFNQNKAKYFEK